MTVLSYQAIYREAQARPEFYSVEPIDAALKFTDHHYLYGTYLFSLGTGFCEYIVTYVALERRINQIVLKLVCLENQYLWKFGNLYFRSINELITNSPTFLYPYTPLMKLRGYVPHNFVDQVVKKVVEEGDYFLTANINTVPLTLDIYRFSKETKTFEQIRCTWDNSTVKIPKDVKSKFGLKRPLCLKLLLKMSNSPTEKSPRSLKRVRWKEPSNAKDG